MNTVDAKAKASRFSYYITNDYYLELIADFSGWQDDARAVDDLAERDLFRRLLEKEARLLDQTAFDAWLDMYVPECVYWAPGTVEIGDPRTEIAVTFEDRRRMEDRVYRMRTGFAWSQVPLSRTARMVSNVEVFHSPANPQQRMVRANFVIHEFWDGEVRALVGWSGYRVRKVDGKWLISAKQVNLLNRDQCIRNPSIIL